MALTLTQPMRRIPVVPQSAPPRTAQRPSSTAPGQRVLVVDDNAQVRAALVRFLHMNGLSVSEAVDGPSGVETCHRIQPDLVLLDVDMPGFDGFEACRRLKSAPSSALVPVLFLTALDTPESRQKGAEVGGDGYLTKPVHLAEMMARVRAGLKQKQLTDALSTAESTLRAQAAQVESRFRNVGHGRRVSRLADKVAEKMGLSQDMRRTIGRAAEVHDIGMIAIPETVLLKSDALSDAEWEMLRRHPVVGEQLCSPFREYRDALPIIRHHHERRDGSGYPDRLVGDEIPVGARVLQVAEVYDALTTARPYAAAVASAEALLTIENETRQGRWDGEAFSALRASLAGGAATGAMARMAATPVY